MNKSQRIIHGLTWLVIAILIPVLAWQGLKDPVSSSQLNPISQAEEESELLYQVMSAGEGEFLVILPKHLPTANAHLLQVSDKQGNIAWEQSIEPYRQYNIELDFDPDSLFLKDPINQQMLRKEKLEIWP